MGCFYSRYGYFFKVKTYLVGGAVRDQLLGLDILERDWVVVGSDVETMLAQNYKPVGKDFPVFLHPKTKEEYALARTERKTGAGYKGFVCHASPEVTLEEDLLRRDLTINAIAMDDAGNFIDPYNGINDLKHKILRHVSPAFEEDPVRVLRIARFCARFHHLGFTIAPETAQLMRKMVRQGYMQDLVPERVWNELVKSLSEKNPEYFLKTLRDCGALKRIIPEIDALFGVPNPPKWHPEVDSGWHTYMVLEQAVKLSDSPLVRFAALVHDLGKATTFWLHWPSHHGHDDSGVEKIKQFARRLKIPKEYSELGILTASVHSSIHKCRELTSEKLLTLFEKADAFRRPERFLDMMIACKADARGRMAMHENDPYPQMDYLSELLKLLMNVSTKSFVEKGLSGEAIKNALHQARLDVIGQYKKNAVI